MSSYFDKAFESAFPKHQPFREYQWPKFERTVSSQSLETSPLKAPTVGQRGKMPAKDMTTTSLVTSGDKPPVTVMEALFPARQVTHNQLTISDPNVLGSPGHLPVSLPFAGRRLHDYFINFNFVVQINGFKTPIKFQKIEGLDISFDEIEWRSGTDTHPHKKPGIPRFANIKLTKGVVPNMRLWTWCKAIMDGEVDRRDGSIHMLGDRGDKLIPTVSYNFFGAWPCSWTGLKVDGKGNALLVEELELAVYYVERETELKDRLPF